MKENYINDKKNKSSKKKRNKEKLSTRDIQELMGMNVDRFERRRGAVRRK